MELTRLRKLGALEPGTCSKWVSRIFMVPKPGGVSWRLIIDLRRINLWCKLFSMKLETLKKLRNLARRTDYMFSMDLADGFYCLGIEESARDYFTVSVNGQLWRLAALPMGWCLSPYYFCELMKVWVRAMRAPSVVAPPGRRSRKRGKMRPPSSARGARLLPYVDDFLFLAHSLAAALLLRARVESLLTRLGLKRNPRKGEWEPTQALTHLGMIVDLKQGLFIAPSEKLQAVATLAKGLLGRAARNRRFLPAKALAGLAGKAQFLYLALPVARFYLRELHTVLGPRTDWNGQVKMSNQLQRDLRWWTTVPAERNGSNIFTALTTATLHTDSSQYGWGAVLNHSAESRGFWHGSDTTEHITWKELKAVRMAVECFLPHLQNRLVLLHEDNQAVVGVLTGLTSRSPALMAELRKLWYLLDSHNIWIRPEYIRSAANAWADRLSRETDTDDWQLNPRVFALLSGAWGRPSVDCFASSTNRQLPRFYARWMCPGAEGVDVMARSHDAWRREHNWCNPPWHLLPDLADTLRHSGAEATVIAPYWPDAPWFPTLAALADAEMRLHPRRALFRSGRAGGADALGPPRWHVQCWHIPARPPCAG